MHITCRAHNLALTMHNVYTQAVDSLVSLAHNPRRDRVYYAYMMNAHSRRDLLDRYSRDRMH